MQHGVEKISTRATTLIETLSRSNSTVGSYGGSKVQESRRDNFGTPFRESREFVPFGCSLCDQSQRILYGGRWWFPPSPRRRESCVSKCPWQVLTPKGVPNVKLTRFLLVFGWRFTRAKLVPLPSLIPGLPTRPSTPFLELEAGSVLPSSTFCNLTL